MCLRISVGVEEPKLGLGHDKFEVLVRYPSDSKDPELGLRIKMLQSSYIEGI